ncbi:MAG: phage virion morphogenesis protein [Desulfobacterales bacterium]|nr:phage virion morphogenesis protein [Desulfobacterales bacterium]
MTGAAIEINVKIDDQKVRQLIARIRQRQRDMTPAMKIIGETVRSSVIRNFEKGGRPTKWEPSKKKKGKTLMVQGLGGGLAGSINVRAASDSVIVGTNKKYAAVHQSGAAKGSFNKGSPVDMMIRAHLRKGIKVRAHTRRMKLPRGDIPARPFLMVQDEDWSEIRAALSDYLLGAGR